MQSSPTGWGFIIDPTGMRKRGNSRKRFGAGNTGRRGNSQAGFAAASRAEIQGDLEIGSSVPQVRQKSRGNPEVHLDCETSSYALGEIQEIGRLALLEA